MSDQAPAQSPTVEQRLADWLMPPKQPPQPQQIKWTGAQPPTEWPSQSSTGSDPQPEQQEAQAEQLEGQEQAPEFEEVEYEGERFQVPPKLKKGLMLNQDYTKKTQEVAEQRKAVEISQQQFKLQQQQQQFLDSVQSEVDQIKLIDRYLDQPVDWRNMGTEELQKLQMEQMELTKQRNKLHAELSRKEAEHMASLQGQQEELRRQSREILSRKIPGWNAEVEKDVKEWAISQGFTSEEVSAILNPVHAETLYKARQYDKLVANKTAAQQQASSAMPMAKPGSANPMPQAVKEKLAFNRALSKTAPGTADHQRLVVQRAGSLFSKR